jgi:ubiquinone/menaquinone biosynthesis C-methylase UbiE
LDNVEGFFQGDIRDLSQFEDEQFDIVVCYGAPLCCKSFYSK